MTRKRGFEFGFGFQSAILFGLLSGVVVLTGLWGSSHQLRAPAAGTVLPGRIKPFRAADVSAELSGQIIHVLASRGTQVKEGQLLAVVEGQEPDTEMELARAELAGPQPRLVSETLQTQQVRAPQAGTVLSAPARPGEVVWPGLRLFRIADLRYLQVEVPVSPSMLKNVSIGTPVLVRLPVDAPQQIASTVSALLVAPGAPYQSYLAQITVPNPRPGTTLMGRKCTVEFLPSAP